MESGKTLRIKNALFVTNTLESDKFLYIKDGKILAITEETLPFDGEIDAEWLYVSPGFVDIHTHGAGGFDYADGGVDDILNAAYAHAKNGVTTVFPTAPSLATDETETFVLNVKEAMKHNAPGRPHIAGSHLEGPYFADAQRGAQNPLYIKAPVFEEYDRWVTLAEGTLRRISFAPELEGSRELCAYLRERGIVAGFAHTDGIYEEIKPLIDLGCTVATHLYSGMNTVTRRNMHRKLGAVETALLEDAVTVEVIADGVHLPPALLKLIYKIKGDEHICLVTDSMRGSGMPSGPSVLGPRLTGMPCYVEKDDVAYLVDKSAFAGSVATGARLVKTMYEKVGIPLESVIKMACAVPARVMDMQDRGRLAAGNFADLIFFDEEINIHRVFVEGKELL